MLRNSACEGWVVHRRGDPHHEFRYRVWMLLVDTAALGRKGSELLGLRKRYSTLQLRSTDYLNVGGDVLRGVNLKLSERGLPPGDRAFVLSQPRSWGTYFNPVTFYFCYAAGRLHCVMAEINNTPWDEKHTYVLDARGQQDDELRFRFPKAFHVSPFMPMDIDYCWRVKLREESIRISMRLFRNGDEVFFAGLYLDANALDPAALARDRRRYFLQNLRTLARIYWQAARLYFKRSAFHKHPHPSTEVTTI